MWQFKERDYSWWSWVHWGLVALMAIAGIYVIASDDPLVERLWPMLVFIAYVSTPATKKSGPWQAKDEREQAIRDRAELAAHRTVSRVLLATWVAFTIGGRRESLVHESSVMVVVIGWLIIYGVAYWATMWWIRRQERPDVEQ